MAKKNASTDKTQDATVKQLRADLKRSEGKREQWKKRATRAEAALGDLQTRLRKTEKQASRTRRKAQAVKGAGAEAEAPTLSTPPDADTATLVAPTRPDASWTVAELRAEARGRGLTGLSGKPKAELLEALT